ncbi:MAG TPA: cupin domain-containing protein [Gaiellaceae bacterium]|nr:cupin domain-containing protein [Gaiellaceae bacterium]
MRPVANLFDVETARDADDPAGYESGYAKIAPLVGGAALGASVYVLGEGQAVCPYHWESDEEWLLVLEGRIEVRTPEGDEEVEAGDLVCFPAGPEGAHKTTNRRPETARIVIFSTRNQPAIAGYPDSDKIGVWPPGKLFRMSDAVHYWEGELG